MFESVTRSRAAGRAFLQFHGWLAAMAAHAVCAYGLTAIPRAGAAPDESVEVATYLLLQAPEPPPDVPRPPTPPDSRAAAERPVRAPVPQPRPSEHAPAGAADLARDAELLAPRRAELALATVPRTLDVIPPSGPALDSALLRGLGNVAPEGLAGSAADAAAPGEADDGGAPVVEAAVFATPPRLLNRFMIRRMMGNDYPPRLEFRGIEGQVVVAFIIGVDGRPEMDHVQVVSATHPDFIPAALRGLRWMHFRPAHFDGRSVRVRVTLPMVWQVPHEG
jgi:TonB family protein